MEKYQEMTRDQLKQLEDDLWAAADNLRANSDLGASEYGTPVLGLIFLKFADINYRRHEQAIQAEFDKLDSEMIIGRGLAAIRHRKGRNSYLYYLLKTVFVNEDIIGNGAIFNSVGKDELSKFEIYRHPEALVDKFEEIVRPIDRQIETLIRSTSILTQTRDLLLPRLISGKLSVEDLDIRYPPSMANPESVKA